MRQILFPIFATLFLVSAAMSTSQADPLRVASFALEDGFHDLRIPVTKTSCDKNGACTIEARGLLVGKEIGILFKVAPGMRPGIVGSEIDGTAFEKNGIVLGTVGLPSQNLAEALEKAYGVKTACAASRGEVPLTTFALEGDPKKIQSEHLKFKVFHDDDNKEDLYFELFLNFDLKAGTVELAEKDGEYRKNILTTLFSAFKKGA